MSIGVSSIAVCEYGTSVCRNSSPIGEDVMSAGRASMAIDRARVSARATSNAVG